MVTGLCGKRVGVRRFIAIAVVMAGVAWAGESSARATYDPFTFEGEWTYRGKPLSSLTHGEWHQLLSYYIPIVRAKLEQLRTPSQP